MMELLLVVGSRSRSHEPTPLRLACAPDHTVTDLVEALSTHLGEPAHGCRLVLIRTGLVVPNGLLVDSGLLIGDELDLVPTTYMVAPVGGRIAVHPPVASLDVLAGPEAGRFILLPSGSVAVGTCPGAVRLQGAGDNSVIIELPSEGVPHVRLAAGTCLVDQIPVDQAPLSRTSVVTLGDVSFAIRPTDEASAEQRDRQGQIAFHRTPYRPTLVTPRVIGPVPAPPAVRPPRRFAAVGLALPLVSGAALLVGRGRGWLTVGLVAAGPLVVFLAWLDDRVHGRRSNRREQRSYREQLAELSAKVQLALSDEQAERRQQAPDLGELHRRAHLRTRRLWERDRSSTDFGTIRLGIGMQASQIRLDPVRSVLGDDAEPHDIVTGVPVCIRLGDVSSIGMWGDGVTTTGLVNSALLQCATLHSPQDLVVACALHPSRQPSWLNWLPHSRSTTSPVIGELVTTTAPDADRLLSGVLSVLAERNAPQSQAQAFPWLVIVVDERVGANPALVAAVQLSLNHASLVWLGDSEALVPRGCGAVIDCRTTGQGRLWLTDATKPVVDVELELASTVAATRHARALAPLTDADALGSTAALPARVVLSDVLSATFGDRSHIENNWAHADPRTLKIPIGVTNDGVFTLDLVGDGPHMLVAGTSGSGKSEFLQTLVAGVVAQYPPHHVTVLFIDYKGGASSAAFDGLGHVVGSVSNLEPAMSLRALVSLQAELTRRMTLFEGRARDLDEMLDVAPHDAPPRLLLVVDEFATLVHEVPDFVNGLIDVAQRGRSLGIHLVLATQRPTGVVSDKILANMNLRVALRLLDSAESSSIIGSGAAADIPVPLRGRALVRTGPKALSAVQVAWAGAPTATSRSEPVRVTPLGDAFAPLSKGPASTGDQLRQLVEVAVQVCSDHPAPHRPWTPPLTDNIGLAGLASSGGLLLGVVDRPDAQCQDVWSIDLERTGGLVVLGTSRSGKSTTLRTAALSWAREEPPSRRRILAIDLAGGGLRELGGVPHCIGVAGPDDMEHLTRLFGWLDNEMNRRRKTRRGGRLVDDTDTAEPAILVVIDGFANLTTLFHRSDTARWADIAMRATLEGRSVGIHVVVSADRRIAVPGQVLAAVSARLTLRQSDRDSLVDAGVPASIAASASWPAGRGWIDGHLVQVATASADMIAPVGATLLAPSLPDRVSPFSTATWWDLPLGLSDLDLDVVRADLRYDHLLVAGPPGSGRSSVLRAVRESLSNTGGVVVADARDGVERLTELLGSDTPAVVFVDDAARFDGSLVEPLLERAVRSSTVRLVVAVDSRILGPMYVAGWLGDLRRTRQVLALQPVPGDIQTAAGFALRPGLEFPAGRGVLMTERRSVVVQASTSCQKSHNARETATQCPPLL